MPRIELYTPRREAPPGTSVNDASTCGAIEPKLLQLIKLRASQVRGCAHCMEIHGRAARLGGEAEPRLLALAGWPHSPLFTERERAALAWTEAVTNSAAGGLAEPAYVEARACLDEQSLVELTSAIFAIRSWDHLCATLAAASPGRAAA